MNLTLRLSHEIEARLKEQARRTGQSPEELALEALRRNLADDLSSEPLLSPEDWTRQFDAWVNGLQSRNPQFDDSRESIYLDRC